ncbi:MAG TPA: TetR family transcriptional regulator C-terminal domain-containing protein [Gemmataceae bacterium]|nr:TetR family transcriptional regulator C-terminal domain-containing protein [Gemmataceae bacterium]
MKTSRIDVGSIRRRQIVEAAIAVITEQGLQNLSLSEIEQKAGMSRGQLTYYFPAKEDILLAVFDRLIEMMHEGTGGCLPAEPGRERLEMLLRKILVEPPAFPEFGSLQYTFLSQISHREDFRRRLANLYEEWRSHLATDLAAASAGRAGKKASPRAVATLVQAVIHGLFVQRAADPDAYDREEMVDLLLDMLSVYLRSGEPKPKAPPRRPGRAAVNGAGRATPHEG